MSVGCKSKKLQLQTDCNITARAETVLVRRQVKITSESNTIERRDDGPVTRVVPRFIIVPNFLSGAFLIEKINAPQLTLKQTAATELRTAKSYKERGKQ